MKDFTRSGHDAINRRRFAPNGSSNVHKIKEQVGQVVASDMQASIEALDNAVLMQSRLCASTVEASSDSHLPIASTQGLLESLSGGLDELVQSRARLVKAARHVSVIQGSSNLREVSFGCPNGLALLTTVNEPVKANA